MHSNIGGMDGIFHSAVIHGRMYLSGFLRLALEASTISDLDLHHRMSATITIQLSPSAIALVERFRNSPQQFPEAIKRGMTRSLAIVSGRIQERRLTGRGPFPVSEHRLGERTGQLKLRTRSTPATITSEGNQVVVSGAIGSSAFYAAIHEFGGKKAPERAPFRTGIQENIKYISEEIEREVVKSLKP